MIGLSINPISNKIRLSGEEKMPKDKNGVIKESSLIEEVKEAEEEEGVILVGSELEEPSPFDKIVGCIEDIVIEDEFQELQEELLEKHYVHFDENLEENKFIYTEIYEEYTNRVETFIEAELSKRIPDFDMRNFIQEFEQRKSSLEGEVFDMLFTLTDFMAFKEMFIDYKMMREAGLTTALSSLAL